MSSTPSFKSRYSRGFSPAAVNSPYTPTSIRRTTSPPFSASSTATPLGPQKANVVTRLAIEGKAKQDRDASIRMYLKVNIPLDGTSPGSTIPLFPEENVKILTTMIHPLDAKGSPYSFSSTLCPLLHKAARALNLPPRSRETFHSAHGLPGHGQSSSSTESAPVVEDKYTGHILVSNYHISYVLPKEFPSLYESSGSFGEKTNIQFVAAIDMLVPYVLRPPRAPYLLSLPTPRCLHNNIKLRIFPPVSTSSSFASLSSTDDDIGSWDLASDPHVSRHVPRSTRKDYNLADDESSDSSIIGFADSYGIQGTFPSTERIRIRWAKPVKSLDVGVAGDGRKRTGVKESKGETTCIIKGKVKESILMDVEYKGTCKNLWFPGVATLLGMDVNLDARRCDISWPPGYTEGWKITGGAGYTGFDVGAGIEGATRQNSFDSSSSPAGTPPIPTRNSSGLSSTTSSTSSLLRQPLPNQTVADYSFEHGGTASQTSTATSSALSSILSTPDLTQSGFSDGPKPPGDTITLHVNMNELLPPFKNVFTFKISGPVVITPRSTSARNPNTSLANNIDVEPDGAEPLVLPRFTVHAADNETNTIIVRNEVEGPPTNVEVFNPTGDIHRDPQSRKTVLQKSGSTKCTRGGGRILLKELPPVNGHVPSTPNPNPRLLETPSRSRTPSVSPRSSSPMTPQRPVPKKSGPALIPWANYRVTPLSPDGQTYAVQLRLAAPLVANSDWLEFGLAQPPNQHKNERYEKPPAVAIASVTVNGIPVEYENAIITKPQKESGSPVSAGSDDPHLLEIDKQEWVNWMKIHVQGVAGAELVVDFTVQPPEESITGSILRHQETQLLLPTFTMRIGRLEVVIDKSSELNLAVHQTNLAHRQLRPYGEKFLHFSAEEYFFPRMSLLSSPPSTNGLATSTLVKGVIGALLAILLVLGIFVIQMHYEMREMSRVLPGYSGNSHWLDSEALEAQDPGGSWWFGGDQQSSSAPNGDPEIFTVEHTSISSTEPISTLVPSHSNSVAIRQPQIPNALASIPSNIASLTWEDLRPLRTAATHGARNIGKALHVAWRLLYRAWNYPLAEDEF